MAHSFLINASLPASFWLDALYVVVFTISRLPTPVLREKSPYDSSLARVPDYKFLKSFRCVYFPYLAFANKLSPKSISCWFLGYAPHYKGYRCLDPHC